MGFWNGKVEGSIDKMFDINRDGKLDPWEMDMERNFIMNGDILESQDEYDEFEEDDDEYDEYDEDDEW